MKRPFSSDVRDRKNKRRSAGNEAEEGHRPRRLLMLSSGSYNSTLTIRLRYLARHLANAWKVTIITPPADKYNDFKPDYTLRLNFARLVQPWQFTTRSVMLNLIPYSYSSLVSILHARADMVLIYKPTPITVLGLVPKLLSRPRSWWTWTTWALKYIRNEGRSRLTYGLVDWSERLCMRYANAVVVASTELRDHVRQIHPLFGHYMVFTRLNSVWQKQHGLCPTASSARSSGGRTRLRPLGRLNKHKNAYLRRPRSMTSIVGFYLRHGKPSLCSPFQGV